MPVQVFLSYPKPFGDAQRLLIDGIVRVLAQRGLEPRTLGVNEYDYDFPLAAVRRLLIESSGVLTLGLRRYYVEEGVAKPNCASSKSIDKSWFTSPWPHLETAMGFQLGLPIMIIRETGVHQDGVFDPGVVGRYVLEVDVAEHEAFLQSRQWTDPLASWEHDVRTVARNRGLPPKLY